MKYRFLLFCVFLITLNAFSQDPFNFYNKALEKYSAPQYKEALGLINKGIESLPKNIDFCLLRSNINFSPENLKEGFDDINTSTKNEPENYKGYLRKGRFFNLIRERDKSIPDYSTTLKFAKEDPTKIDCLIDRSGPKLSKVDYYCSCIKDF